MEKISRVVPGNSRVASTDLKSAAPVRPGTPSFGRPVGESTTASPSSTSTAAKAVALHKELQEAKKTRSDGAIVQHMADQFFMNRVRRPDDEVQGPPPAASAPVHAAPVDQDGEAGEEVEMDPPNGYTPRGSFVDVRA